jgi:uncharacterized protein
MRVFLDSNVVIYAVEGHPVFGAPAMARLAASQLAGDEFVVSDLTRLECLVKPLRDQDTAVEAAYRSFFARKDVHVVAIASPVVDRAISILVNHPFKPIDALQIAAALESGAGTFVTNDLRLSGFTGIRIEVL